MIKSLKWINTIAFVAMVVINILANTIPIGNNTTGEVSEAYPNLFTPAPMTFGIWGVIYAFMTLFIIYQWGVFDKGKTSGIFVEEIGLWFAVSCVLNIAWILAWHMREIGLSVILIVALLISLIFIGMYRAAGTPSMIAMLVNVGFEIYLGWIIAAIIANISVFLVKIGWNRFGIPEQMWTIIILIVGALIGSFVVLIENKWVAGAAMVWAYFGILFRYIRSINGTNFYNFLIFAVCLGMLMLIVSIVYELISKRLPMA